MHPRDAGQEMRKLRASSQYKTLSEVENEGIRRWGWEGRIGRHQVSRMENGLIVTPDGNMLGKLSILYDVPVATLFDIWELPYVGQRQLPEYDEMRTAEVILPRLSEVTRLHILAHLKAMIDAETERQLADASDRNRDLARTTSGRSKKGTNA